MPNDRVQWGASIVKQVGSVRIVVGAMVGAFAFALLVACEPASTQSSVPALEAKVEAQPVATSVVDIQRDVDFNTDPYANPTTETVLQERDRFGRVVHFFGDSISGGWTLKRFPPQFTPDEIEHLPVSKFWTSRSPQSVINAEAERLGVHSILSGFTGLPASSRAKPIGALVASGGIRPGDVVVIEDAGSHRRDPDAYESLLVGLREALAPAEALIIMSTTPDAFGAQPRGDKFDDVAFDIPFNGRSHNDAIRAAAAAPIDGKSRTVLIDLNKLFDGGPPGWLLSDGIHFSVAGQCVWLQAIADSAEFPRPGCSTDPAQNPPFAQ